MLLIGFLVLAAPAVLRHLETRQAEQDAAISYLNSQSHVQLNALHHSLTAFSRTADQMLSHLEEAELLLIFYKQRREPGLILKNVGDSAGKLGVGKLRGQHLQLRAELKPITTSVGKAALAWELAGHDLSPQRLARARQANQDVQLHLENALSNLTHYLVTMESSRPLVDTWVERAPLVVTPLPQVMKDLPGMMDRTHQVGLNLIQLLEEFPGRKEGKARN